ncbi:efflux RND transporter periplasmic adaptor subunit [Flavobacterium humi]|uniref:Efflux RND transporter periplasmic adaptor subunit n=1 Tax=Flavobacterium humi TaxID=2562683 RepID=A0A4Z0LBN1_9FLAO|nr:efflux RND transporter periplasmic adaptor subunit [Flavobacterium humi]TGD59257.1 efflux RND transporter periplasmic adaptor subunit [Flavobacterium humi]
MKKKQILLIIFLAVAVIPILFTACTKKAETKVTQEKVQTYTCPMHPQIVKNGPGTCPICSMDLVPFEKNNAQDFLILGASQRALANLNTMKVGENEFSHSSRLNGRLVTNPEQTVYVSSRVAGRIEVLYVKETGVPIRKGEPLYKIYSEQLSSLQQEYLIATAQVSSFPEDKRFYQMKNAARQKLLLYGQSEAQLSDLVKKQKVSPYVTYFAPNSGIIAELSVTEGQYVAEGSSIMKLEDYDRLWVEADVYPSDADKIRTGQKVQVIVSGYEDQPQTMTVDFINPALQTSKQIMQLRGTISNPNNQWQAGLQAIVLLPFSGQKYILALPVDAVIRDGNGSHVWVEIEKGKYQPRMVSLGAETFDEVEITGGLKNGETVVVSGAYLLYSEFILKKGKNPMSGMKM